MNYKPLIILLIFLSIPIATAVPSHDIGFTILNNDGLTKYSSNNYTFKCEEANTNILTIILSQESGYTYMTIQKEVNNRWVDTGYNTLDQTNNIYQIQFHESGLYRFHLYREINTTTIIEDYQFVNIKGADGEFIAGDVQTLIERGQWLKNMEQIYGRQWPGFRDWASNAFRVFSNPFYMVTDVLATVAMLFLMPHTWFIIAIIFILVYIILRRRISVTRRERQLKKKHGSQEDLIKKTRLAEEEERLHQLHTMPIDHALEKYSFGGHYRPRAICYDMGIEELGVNYPTAFSLSFDLGRKLFADNESRRKEAEEIIDALVEQYAPTLERTSILQDISACARAVSAESVEGKSKIYIKDTFGRIAEEAEKRAKQETSELSKKIKLKSESDISLSKTIENVQKKKAKGDKSGSTKQN